MAQEDVITLGTSSGTNNNIPVSSKYAHSLTQSYYAASLINKDTDATVTHIAYMVGSGTDSDYPFTRHFKIYMRCTGSTSAFPSSGYAWNNMTNEELVFDGDVTITKGEWITIKLDKAFNYKGGESILVCVNSYNGDFQMPADNVGFNRISASNTTLYNRGSSAYDATSLSKTSKSKYNYAPHIQLTFGTADEGGDDTQKPSPEITFNYIIGGSQNGVFKPSLTFTTTNATQYQVLLSTTNDFSDNVSTLVDWTEGSGTIATPTMFGLTYNPATTYYVKVVAKNGSTDKDPMTEAIYTFMTKSITDAPGAISNISPATSTSVDGNPNLSWDFGSNTERYQVLLGEDENSLDIVRDWTNIDAATSSASYQTSGLASNTTYYWQVNTQNQESNGTTSSEIFSFTKLGAPNDVTPVYPTNNATDISNTATLTWSFDQTTTHYRVLMDYRGGFEYVAGTSWIPTNGATTASFETASLGLGAGKTYSWAVDVKNNSGERVYYAGEGQEQATSFSYTTSNLLPAICNTPSNGTVLTQTTTTLEWSYQGNATHYKVLLGTDERDLQEVKGWTERETVGTGLSGTGSYTTETLTNNTKYYWQIVVKNGENGQEIYSNTMSFISMLSNPTFEETRVNLYPGSNNAAASTQIQWSLAQGASKYNIYVNGNLQNTTTSQYTNYYNVEGLYYNNGNANNVKITALYTIDGNEYESQGATVNVYVSGYAYVEGAVTNELSYDDVADATVTYVGTTILGDEMTINGFTTNNNGIFSGNIPVGTYYRMVSAPNFNDNEGDEKDYEYDTYNRQEHLSIYPNIPENITNFSATESHKPVLSWTFAEHTTHYRVLIGTNENDLAYSPNNQWIATNGETTATFQTSDLLSNKKYMVYVDVKNENASPGERTYFGNEYGITPDVHYFNTLDVAPVQYTAPAQNEVMESSVVTLEWNYGSGNSVTHYQVLLNVDGQALAIVQDWTERATEGTGMVSSGSFTTGSLNTNSKYNWKVNVKKGENGEIIEGETWSFVTPLVIPNNLTATPANVYPTQSTAYTTGSTTLDWTAIDGALGYNVYLNNELIENPGFAVTTTSNSYNLTGLSYNMEEGHAIQVSAVYEGLGESAKTEACYVKVTGYANVNGIVKNESGNNIENVAITIVGTDKFGAEQSYEFTTNEDGAYSGKVLEGEYTMTIEKDEYISTSKTMNIDAGETYSNHFTLISSNVFIVTITDATMNNIKIYLENSNWNIEDSQEGTYNIYYQKDNGDIMSVTSWFIRANSMSTTLVMADDSEFKTTWAGLSNGSYKIGVSNVNSSIINWCSKSIVRNYYIFTTAGNYEDASNWENGEMPSNNEDAFINAAAIINSDVTAKNVTITSSGSLTINGSLTATNVINEGAIGHMSINDGGQLRQNNNELNGEFIMNIATPEVWSEQNKDGWQIISSPFTNAAITDFTGIEDDEYDLYKFDGSNTEAEWINHKVAENNFEETFKVGRGYLASYAETETFKSRGLFNAATSYQFNVIYSDSESKYANFNLLGNPFTFNMDLSKFEATGLATGFAVIKNDGTYDYLTTGTINVGDGFFVKATEATANLSYDDNKVVRTENNSSINIILECKAGSDNAIINFAGSDKAGFPKLKNFNDAVSNIYIANNEKRYAIFNYDNDVKEIEVAFEAKQFGNYTISIEANGEFETVILVDKVTGTETNMLLEDYSFMANEGNSNRFVVKMVNGQQSTDDNNFVYQSGEELIINAEGTVQIIDMMGRIVYNMNVENTNHRIDVSAFNNSAYIVRVINENEIKTQKVVIY